MMKPYALFAFCSLFSIGLFAAEADQVIIENPVVRLAPPNAPATGAFMVIHNQGDSDIKLVKAQNPASEVTELHDHINEGGVMKMRPIPSVDIKAKGQAVIKRSAPKYLSQQPLQLRDIQNSHYGMALDFMSLAMPLFIRLSG